MEVDTDPDVRESIIKYLTLWQLHDMQDPLPGNEQFLVKQHLIRWGNVFEGWMSSDWEEAQQNYYNFLKYRRTSK
jgi:hypothetical protein